MAKVQLPIAQGFYVSDSLPLSAQRCVNWQPSVPQTSTITDANLFVTPGLVQLLQANPLASCRGAHVMAGIPYFVIGDQLIRVNRSVDDDGEESFTFDALGSVAGVDRVYMADNGTQLCIVAPPDSETGGLSYIFTEPGSFQGIVDGGFDGPAASVVFVDGFFVFHKADGKKFFNSPLNNGLGPYDPLDFSSANVDPDQIRRLGVYRNLLHVFGSETIEIFRNIGRVPAPFQRVSGGVIQLGIFADQSLELYDDTLVFVGGSVNDSPAVWRVSGASKQRISTIAIDNALSDLTQEELEAVFSWTYSESGAFFYAITLPDTTFVFDSVNGRWHERISSQLDVDVGYRVSHMITAYGRVMVGDRLDGRVGEIKEDVFTEYGALVRRFVTSRPFDSMGGPIFVASMEAVCESGVGLLNDREVDGKEQPDGFVPTLNAGKDPEITLFWSDDGARTFVGGISRSLGKIGEYTRRQIWRKIGRVSRDRVVLLEVSTPNKATLIKLEADIMQGVGNG